MEHSTKIPSLTSRHDVRDARGAHMRDVHASDVHRTKFIEADRLKPDYMSEIGNCTLSKSSSKTKPVLSLDSQMEEYASILKKMEEAKLELLLKINKTQDSIAEKSRIDKQESIQNMFRLDKIAQALEMMDGGFIIRYDADEKVVIEKLQKPTQRQANGWTSRNSSDPTKLENVFRANASQEDLAAFNALDPKTQNTPRWNLKVKVARRTHFQSSRAVWTQKNVSVKS
jgi:hypothetical protein